jgi:hypothetical protein
VTTRGKIEKAYRKRDEKLVDAFKTLRNIVNWYDKKGKRWFITEPEWVGKAREVLTRQVPI